MKLSVSEIESVYILAEKLTGSHQQGRYRKDILVTNVERRMSELGLSSLRDYLQLVATNRPELERLISSLTIHTTSWFRENSHFETLSEKFAASHRQKKLKILIAACSSGQETYSLGIMLEVLREGGKIDDYELISCDIDALVVEQARAARYSLSEMAQIPLPFQRFLSKNDKSQSFEVCEQIRKRCRFMSCDLRQLGRKLPKQSCDLVLCRNVLIYFHSSDIPGIIEGFDQLLLPQGYLCLGHNEMIDLKLYPQLEKVGNSIFKKRETISSATPLFHPDVLLLGASTGGTSALMEILSDMPRTCSPVVVVQHINEHFAGDFARRLTQVSGLQLYEGSYPTALEAGFLYMSVTARHIVLVRRGRSIAVDLIDSPPINRHRPSVDALFHSAVDLPLQTMAMLLTGMGSDGAEGLEALKKHGAFTIAQDEGSCTVYGMPRSAIDRGAACLVGDLPQIRRVILKALQLPKKRKVS